MRQFYQLRDDVALTGRWHVGEVLAEDGSEPLLDACRPWKGPQPLLGVVDVPGFAPDFSLSSFGVPLVRQHLGEVFSAIGGDAVQRIPLSVEPHAGIQVLNALLLVDCIDEEHSEFVKWVDGDHRADLIGQYRQVTRLRLDRGKIPGSAQVFRLAGWPVALVVSDLARAAMEDAGCVGARFDAV